MPGRKAVTKISGIQGLRGGMARASPSAVIHKITAAIAGMTPSGRGKMAGWRVSWAGMPAAPGQAAGTAVDPDGVAKPAG